MTVKDLLNQEYMKLKENDIEDAALQARMILASVLKCSKEKLIIKYNDEIDEKKCNLFIKDISKLIKGIPVQYIIHNQEFMKLNFYVDDNVLIPRADTEILVEEVIDIINKINIDKNKQFTILDMCTGSGAIIVSLAKYLSRDNENINYKALDISVDTLSVARRNSISNRVNDRIEFIESDMFINLNENEKFDIIVSNPPYIESKVVTELSKQVKNEPHIALDGGKDGLDFYRLIAENAHKYLKQNGYVCVEIGYDQKESVMKLFEKNGFKNIYSKKDLYSNDRIVIAKI